jgi:hypothetical protein
MTTTSGGTDGSCAVVRCARAQRVLYNNSSRNIEIIRAIMNVLIVPKVGKELLPHKKKQSHHTNSNNLILDVMNQIMVLSRWRDFQANIGCNQFLAFTKQKFIFSFLLKLAELIILLILNSQLLFWQFYSESKKWKI